MSGVNSTELTIINLAKCAIDGISVTVPKDLDWKEMLQLCNSHKLLSLVCEGMNNSSIDFPEEVAENVNNIIFSYLIQDQQQLFEISKLQDAFSKNDIDHMLIKGPILKRMYPKTDLRPMSDGDILIRLEQKDKIFNVMRELGYTEIKESAHEFVWGKGAVCIELHKYLVPPYNKDFTSYFGDGWGFAKSIDGKTSRYELSVNDHYIYMFTHFAEHYRDGGIGMLHMVDLWLYARTYDIDREYICTELKKLGLFEFYKNIMHTVDVWFNGAKPDEMSDFITRRIFDHGLWGTKKSRAVAQATRKTKVSSSKLSSTKQIFSNIFPSVEKLQYRFPYLKKYKFLLPFAWGVRWLDAVLFKRDRVRNKLDDIKQTTEDNISSYQKELDYVGLDFNYKE